jgi:hypothetical protein
MVMGCSEGLFKGVTVPWSVGWPPPGSFVRRREGGRSRGWRDVPSGKSTESANSIDHNF